MVRKLKKGGFIALLVLMSFCLMVTPIGAASGTDSQTATQATANTNSAGTGSFEKVFSNSKLAFYYSKKTGDFYVQDQDGAKWNSLPEDGASGKYSSQLVVNYKNLSSENTITAVMSTDGSVKKNGLNVKVENGSLVATYTFANEGFVVPVEYKLLDDGLQVSIKTTEIQENVVSASNKGNVNRVITSMQLLPYFGAGGISTNGYMVVPDGSGAVINYNNGKSNYEDYKQYIYGRDTAIEMDSIKSSTENAKLPVFGIKNGDSAMLAVIHSGESRAIVNAAVTLKGNDAKKYNTVYPEFIYRNYTNTNVNDQQWNEKQVTVYENSPTTKEDYSVQYYFLPKDKSNYVGMSQRYQKYLQDEKQVETTASSDTYPFYVDLFGCIHKRDSFLGFPIYKDIALTSFSDAEKIMKQLKDSGVDNLVLKYNAWLSGGPDGSIPVDVSVSGALGGKNGLKSLTNYMSANGISSFFNLDLTNMYKTRWGYDKSDSAKGLDHKPSMVYRYLPSTFEQDTRDNYSSAYLLKPTKINEAATKVAEKLKDLQISGASLDTLGSQLYSSFNQAGMDRESAESIWIDGMQKVKDSRGQLMMDSPNGYVLPYTTYISSLPVESSGYSIEDYSIPFYQMAIHGLTSYSAPAINQTSDYKQSVLKALETGSSLQFTWISTNKDKIENTAYDTLYSAEYTDWINDAIQSYNDVSGVMKRVATAKIVGYDRLQDGVTKTTYDNGISIVVNYNNEAVTVDGVSIAAMNYGVEEVK